MQISPDDLLAEAGRMALELRLKDQLIAEQVSQIADLTEKLHQVGAPGVDSPSEPGPGM
jgi:hypothetical protein